MGSSGHKTRTPYELIRQIPRAHKAFGSELAALEDRSAVLLGFFYLVEQRGLCVRTFTAQPGIRVGRHSAVPPSQG